MSAATKKAAPRVEITDEFLRKNGACYARIRSVSKLLPIVLTKENVAEQVEAFLLSQARRPNAVASRLDDLRWLVTWREEGKHARRKLQELAAPYRRDEPDWITPYMQRWPREDVVKFAASVRKYIARRPVTFLRGLRS